MAHHRDFPLLWIGGLLSGLGGYVAALAVPLLVLAETGSPARAGLVTAVGAAAALVCLLPAGALADAVERRRLMVISQLGTAALAATLAVFVLIGQWSFALVLIVAGIGPVMSSLYGPAAMALLAAAVPADELGLAVSRLQARTAIARLVGPLAGGALFAVSPALPLMVEVAGLAGSVLCLLAVRARAVPAARPAAALRIGHLTAGVRYLWRQPFLRNTTLFFGAGLNTGFAGVMTAAITAAALRDPSGRTSGVIAAAAATGGLAGSLLAPRLKVHAHPHATVMLAGCVCAAAVALLVVFTGPAAVALLVAACLAAGSLGSVALMAAMLSGTPPDLLGRVRNAAGLSSMAAQPLGPLAAGFLLEHATPRTAFGVFAAVIGGCVLVALSRRPVTPPASFSQPFPGQRGGESGQVTGATQPLGRNR